MPQLPDHYRMAGPEDAFAMAELVNMAGEGLPLYLWSGIAAPGQSPWEVGQNRARREYGSFSWRNTIVRDDCGQVAAAMVGYALAEDPEPASYTDMPPMFVPLQQLEDMVPGTWYVNVLATYPSFRNKGYGKNLLGLAEVMARGAHCRGLSIIVANTNDNARKLYDSLGYLQLGEQPVVKDGWRSSATHWLLLYKPLN